MYCTVMLEINENIEAEVNVWFDCTFRGCGATYLDPAEPPEFDITDIEVEVLYGKDWEKTGRELQEAGWLEAVEQEAGYALESYDELYDHQLDAFHMDAY